MLLMLLHVYSRRVGQETVHGVVWRNTKDHAYNNHNTCQKYMSPQMPNDHPEGVTCSWNKLAIPPVWLTNPVCCDPLRPARTLMRMVTSSTGDVMVWLTVSAILFQSGGKEGGGDGRGVSVCVDCEVESTVVIPCSIFYSRNRGNVRYKTIWNAKSAFCSYNQSIALCASMQTWWHTSPGNSWQVVVTRNWYDTYFVLLNTQLVRYACMLVDHKWTSAVNTYNKQQLTINASVNTTCIAIYHGWLQMYIRCCGIQIYVKISGT